MRPTLFQLSYIRHHALRGRDYIWIASHLEMTLNDVLMAVLEMSNVDQRESQGDSAGHTGEAAKPSRTIPAGG